MRACARGQSAARLLPPSIIRSFSFPFLCGVNVDLRCCPSHVCVCVCVLLSSGCDKLSLSILSVYSSFLVFHPPFTRCVTFSPCLITLSNVIGSQEIMHTVCVFVELAPRHAISRAWR